MNRFFISLLMSVLIGFPGSLSAQVLSVNDLARWGEPVSPGLRQVSPPPIGAGMKRPTPPGAKRAVFGNRSMAPGLPQLPLLEFPSLSPATKLFVARESGSQPLLPAVNQKGGRDEKAESTAGDPRQQLYGFRLPKLVLPDPGYLISPGHGTPGSDVGLSQPGWTGRIFKLGLDKEVTDAIHILDRPYRPFHFYGNTVRRQHYRGNPLPLPRDFFQSGQSILMRRELWFELEDTVGKGVFSVQKTDGSRFGDRLPETGFFPRSIDFFAAGHSPRSKLPVVENGTSGLVPQGAPGDGFLSPSTVPLSGKDVAPLELMEPGGIQPLPGFH